MATLSISNTEVTSGTTSSNSNTPVIPISGTNTIPYTPISYGKPLCVEIMTVYTGSFKDKKFLGGNKKDILCVSGTKSLETFDATPRALNLLQHNVAENSFLEFSAFSTATPYVYYKEAVTDNTIDITIELTADAFNENLFSAVAGLMSKAAGLPIFMPAAGKLLAGSQLVNLLQSGSNQLFATSPFLSETITVRFDTAGMPVNAAQSLVVCRDEDQAELSTYAVQTIEVNGNAEMRLVNNTGTVYNGASPYIILNLDGASKSDLVNWTATLASSSVLSQFYGSDDVVDTISSTLQQAMGLYNDYQYFTRALAIGQDLKTATPGTQQYTDLTNQYQANTGNIQSSVFSSQLPKTS